MIETTHLLDGLDDPRKPSNSQAPTGLDNCLTRQLKTYGIKDTPAKQKNPPPWNSFTPLCPRQHPPPTPRTTIFPTWSNWTYTSTSGTGNTLSAQATVRQSSSKPSWTLCSFLGTFSYPWTNQSTISTKRLILSSPCTTRKMPSKVRPSLDSDRSPPQPSQFKWVSTYSFTC